MEIRNKKWQESTIDPIPGYKTKRFCVVKIVFIKLP